MSQNYDSQSFAALFAQLNRGVDPESYTVLYERVVNQVKENAPYLIEVLGDKGRSDSQRGLAAQLLAEFRDERAIRPLILAMENRELEMYVEEALKIFGHAVVGPLCEVLLDYTRPAPFRAKLAELLGKLKDKRALDSLMRVLENIPARGVSDNFTTSFAELQAGMTQLKASLQAMSNFFKKYPGLQKNLEGYFIFGALLPDSGVTSPYDTQEFEVAFSRAAGLVRHEKDLGKAKELAASELANYFEPEVRDDIVSFLALDRPLEELADQNENLVRVAAAKALGWLGDERAVTSLTNALEDDSARVRAGAAMAFHLGQFKDERARLLLLTLLKDENDEAREWAARALKIFGEIFSSEQLAELEKALYRGDRWQRHSAANTLAQLGEAGTDILLRALQSDQLETLMGVISATGFSKSRRVLPALLEKLKHPSPDIKTETARTLGFLEKEVLENEAGQVVTALIELAQDPLEEPRVIKEVATALQRFEDVRAIKPLIALLQREVENPPPLHQAGAPYNESEARRGMAHIDLRDALVRSLTFMKANEAVDLLISIVSDERDLDFRRAEAVRSLGYIRDERGFATVLEAIKKPQGNIREAAAIALGYFGDRRGFEPLVDAFYNDKYLVPSRALVALGKLKDPRSFEHLLGGLKHSEGLIRYSAAEGLGELGDSKAIPQLMEALGDQDPEVRFEAAQALGKLGATEALGILKKMAEFDKGDVCFCCHAGAQVCEAAETAIQAIEGKLN